MAAASADQERQAGAKDIGGDHRAFLDCLVAQEPRIGVRVFSESHDARIFRASVRRKPRKVFIVSGKDSNPALRETLEDFGFCVRDLSHRFEELDMNRSHPGDDCDIGRTRCVSGVISPAWFMPISKTPKAASRGIRAIERGRPRGCYRISPRHECAPTRKASCAASLLCRSCRRFRSRR